jgi:hypothetical protein
MKKTAFLLLILLFSLSSCEKDDICDPTTPTTPRVVIQFYDSSNPSVLKNVTNLSVIGQGKPEALISSSNQNTISIPLKTTENSTTYRFVLNSGSSLNNEDVIRFDYTGSNVYVSRACGFKTIFTLNPINPFTHYDPIVADGLWMKQIILQSNNITTENEAHVKIYF